MKKGAVTTNSGTRFSDTTYHFSVKKDTKSVGDVTITVRNLENGDLFLFTKLENHIRDPLELSADLPVVDANRYEMIDFGIRPIEIKHDPTLGEDPTTHPIGLLKLFSSDQLLKNIVVSKNYVSRSLSKDYGNGQISTLRELISEEKSLNVEVSSDQVNLVLSLLSTGHDISENWALVSSEPLFTDEQNLMNWIDYSIESHSHVNKWYSAHGPYQKLPWSIEPFTKLGYGRNIGKFAEDKALEKFEENGERYFYDLILNSVANLSTYREEKGTDVWETEYTSTWLKRAYGTTAPFIDTRHNEKLAIFLRDVGNLLDLDELKDYQLNYADYLVSQIKVGNIIRVDHEYVIADYFSVKSGEKTHASLNHVLGGLTILLDSYKETTDEQYLITALHIQGAINQLGGGWIRESGDLWYQVNPDLTFSGNDYQLLTLVDLLTVQNLWEEVGMTRSLVNDGLIRTKTKYLIEQDVELYPYIEDMLEEQGFGDLF